MMITANINEQDEIITSGQIEVDDNYPGFCCAGYAWEVALIFPYQDPNDNSIWGVCRNPECHIWDGKPGDYYRGVNSMNQEDFLLSLLEENQIAHQLLKEAEKSGVFKCMECQRHWEGNELYQDSQATPKVWTCGDPSCGGRVNEVKPVS